MADARGFIVGEESRTLDERHRLVLPAEMVELLAADDSGYMLAKERRGCLSLWSRATWQGRLDRDVALVRSKMEAGRLEGRLEEVQLLGRLLSSRYYEVNKLGERHRLTVPEGFREFLAVEAGDEVMVVGAAVCVELWNPARWREYLEQRMPEFRQVLDSLAK